MSVKVLARTEVMCLHEEFRIGLEVGMCFYITSRLQEVKEYLSRSVTGKQQQCRIFSERARSSSSSLPVHVPMYKA